MGSLLLNLSLSNVYQSVNPLVPWIVKTRRQAGDNIMGFVLCVPASAAERGGANCRQFILARGKLWALFLGQIVVGIFAGGLPMIFTPAPLYGF